MDWSSRYVISWRLSNSLDAAFCVECLEDVLEREETPGIFNTYQGSQFTGEAFTGTLKAHGIRISMDGKGRALDNRMIERLWRTVKYDDICVKAYETMDELYGGLDKFFCKYNTRKHQTLWMSPEQEYREIELLKMPLDNTTPAESVASLRTQPHNPNPLTFPNHSGFYNWDDRITPKKLS